jgi:hypothetical protein
MLHKTSTSFMDCLFLKTTWAVLDAYIVSFQDFVDHVIHDSMICVLFSKHGIHPTFPAQDQTDIVHLIDQFWLII